MTDTPLRYAVIGAGGIAQVHLQAIATLPGVTVVGIADPADPQTWRISGPPAAAPRFQDMATMLRETRPDLVSVCTPNKFHHPATLLALRSAASADAMLAAVTPQPALAD